MSRTKKIFLWIAGIASGSALIAAAVTGYYIWTSKPPLGELEAARAALDGAAKTEARKYAKAEYEIASTYMQDASRAYRKSEVLLLGFMDYDDVARQLEVARLKADDA